MQAIYTGPGALLATTTKNQTDWNDWMDINRYVVALCSIHFSHSNNPFISSDCTL